MPISDAKLAQIRRKQEEFRDALLEVTQLWTRDLDEVGALEAGRRAALEPVLVSEFLRYWVNLGEGDASWLVVADRLTANARPRRELRPRTTAAGSHRQTTAVTNPSHPIVYISYAWVDEEREGKVVRAADRRAREVAEVLRAGGVDVRLDVYAHEGLHGQRPPLIRSDDPRDPWHAWAMRQIAESDVVLMLCTPEYVSPDSGDAGGSFQQWAKLDLEARIGSRARALWWSWLAIQDECSTNPQKFVPVGWGPYNPDWVPGFVRGATYYRLDTAHPGALDTLLRRIRQVWHDRSPRSGVFVSYAHNDEKWLERLLTELERLTDQHGVEVWTDRDIAPGDNWHLQIQNALDRAQVGIMLVSPNFLQSAYITSDELPKMLRAAESEGLKIFWLPVVRTDSASNPMAKFQAAHTPDLPLAELTKARAAKAITETVAKLQRLLGLPLETRSLRT